MKKYDAEKGRGSFFARVTRDISRCTFIDIIWNVGADKSFCNNVCIPRRQNPGVEAAAAVVDIYPPDSEDELNA